jgi:LysM repeat protein
VHWIDIYIRPRPHDTLSAQQPKFFAICSVNMSDYNNNNNNNYQQGGYQHNGQQNTYGNPNGGYGQQQGRSGAANEYYGGQQNLSGQGYSSEPPQYQQYPSAAAHSSNSGRNSENQGYQNQYGGAGDPEGDRGIMGGLAGGAAGAFGGHALGGKAGHGTSGTIVGALAGAFAGHKTQDAAEDWKHKHDDKKEEKKHEQQQQQYDTHHSDNKHDEHHNRGDFGGNFTSSSQDIRLDAHGDYNLHAQCRRADGSYQSSTISLNQIIENDGGSFRWSSGSGNGASTYTVQQGDTLRAIAGRFSHCSYEELARHNNISNPDMIYPGQNLQVPGGGSRGGGNFGASARNIRLEDGGQSLKGELERDGQWHQRSLNLDERIGNRGGCLEFV